MFAKPIPIQRAVAAVAFAAFVSTAFGQWKPADGPLKTRWTKDVRADKALPEYPRPQMVRKEWRNLNGLWDFALTPKSADQPTRFVRKILVPFPVESSLSGVMQPVSQNDRVWYRRAFTVPVAWSKGRVLLHFGAVDWDATVKVNGQQVGRHQGGYDPFTFDVTKATKPGENEVVVSVWDPTDSGTQPRGKQVLKPGGIFYTPTTGIWQTVWLESVPMEYIRSLKIETWPKAGQVEVKSDVVGMSALSCKTETLVAGRVVASSDQPVGQTNVMKIANAKLWSPESPYLYSLRLTLHQGSKVVDRVDSYFGFREVSLVKDGRGRTRIGLNGKPYFMVGPLDQGFWPDGIYTAPTDEALKYDLDVTKRLGFNMIRKHVKVEPDRWYYWCDKMGILVWQDMPSGDKFIGGNDPDITRSPESAADFQAELKALIDTHRNHPSIVTWILYNEGWGQWDTARMSQWIKDYDPKRLLDSVTGWTDRKVGDMIDWHVYPGPGSPKPEPTRAAVLGEFGGLGLPMPGHMWKATGWGYRSFKTREELTDALVKVFTDLHLLIGSPGVSAAVYTQTTDVETELNGLMPYDRSMIKADEARVTAAIKELYKPAPVVRMVVPTSEDSAVLWRYSFDRPAGEWNGAAYDASTWKEGPGGFGTEETPGVTVRTVWNTPDIWIRRTFTLPAGANLKRPALAIHHDEDAEVYLDGKLIAAPTGYTSSYGYLPLKPDALRRLTPGPHTLAVHCHQTQGGQYIDVGIVDLG